MLLSYKIRRTCLFMVFDDWGDFAGWEGSESD